jgi:hypothetical protein
MTWTLSYGICTCRKRIAEVSKLYKHIMHHIDVGATKWQIFFCNKHVVPTDLLRVPKLPVHTWGPHMTSDLH